MSPTRTYGPCRLSKLELMGIRFMVPNADEGAGAATGAAAEAGATADTGAATGTASADTTGTSAAAVEKVEDLPDWAQRVIRDARKGEGDYRAAAKTAAETAQKEYADKIAIALGLKPDAAADPAALTASLSEAQHKAATAARELAIYKAAGAHGADPSKLLDSNAFISSVSGIDPADGTAVAAAIKAAVDANPNLKAARAAGASSIENPGGTGEVGQITEAQLAQMTPEQIEKAFNEGKLANLLG